MRRRIAAHRMRQELNCHVLLVEDGPDNQRLIAFLLKKAGARVTVAENGQIALDLALKIEECPRSDRPDPHGYADAGHGRL